MILFFYLLLLFFIFFFELFRKKEVFIDFLSIFHLFFIFTYMLPSIVFLSNPSFQDEWKFLALYPKALESSVLFLSIFIGYISIVTGYAIASKKSTLKYPIVTFKYGEKNQFSMLVVFFCLSLSAFFLYAYGHGGLVDLILSGKDIRAKREHAGLFQYFAYFASGLTLSMLLFYSFKEYAKDKTIIKYSKRLFVIAVVAALLYAVGTAGRGNIGMIFVFLTFLYFNINRPSFNIKTFLIFLIFICFIYLLVTYGKSAIWTLHTIVDGSSAYYEAFLRHREWYVSQDASNSLNESLIAFFSQKDHPLVGLHIALNFSEIYQSPRLFLDWIRAFVSLIPGINQPEFIVSSTASGLGRDFLNTDGYVPPGWIAMKIINGGFIWLFAGSFIAGYIGGFLNKLMIVNWYASPLIPGLFIYFGFFWNSYIVGPDPFMFFLPNLTTFLILILIGWMVVFKTQTKEIKSV